MTRVELLWSPAELRTVAAHAEIELGPTQRRRLQTSPEGIVTRYGDDLWVATSMVRS